MKMISVRVPQLAWYEDDELEFQFPATWEVSVCRMTGHDRPSLSPDEIRRAVANPIGTRPIRELAKGRREVAIIFDDMTRPTRVAEILPFVLEELQAAGVRDGGVRFIAAVGAHGALTRHDFVKKLGEAVLERFPVYNHNPYENCTYLGETGLGTPVSINSEVMACDVKIGFGSILPHPLTGFGGGGKIILPGVASIDTMAAHHRDLVMRLLTEGRDPGIGLATFENNLMRQDIAEAARMAGLDVKIDVVLNGRGRTTGLFAGDPEQAHAGGVRLARETYATKAVEGSDIVILNAYSKASEVVLAVPTLGPLLGKERVDVVFIANAPEGQVTHYLVRSFGKGMGGRLWSPASAPPDDLNDFIVLTPHIDIAGADWLATPESIVWAKTWPEVLDRLAKRHGDRAKVALVPDATMQYFA